MNTFRLSLAYLRYLLTSDTKHGIHSPFVYVLLTEVIQGKMQEDIFTRIEQLRKHLLHDQRLINVNDFGAGSRVNASPRRKVADIARNSLASKKYGQLLYRIAHHFQPQHMLELGTSLGITSMYLASASPQGKLSTVEGSPEIAAIARDNFDKGGLHNIDLYVDQFDRFLPDYVKTHPPFDLVFVDGNHRKTHTLDYFRQCLANIHNNSVFIFDDIYWSVEMKEAWEEIKLHPRVTVTLDLFFMGLVFFREEQAKQHFKIKF